MVGGTSVPFYRGDGVSVASTRSQIVIYRERVVMGPGFWFSPNFR